MSMLNQHIVSSLQWSTSFDRKDKASELQERISSWSKARVHKVFAEVFDQLCPTDQTWRIGSLELDLGPIDYNELESELSLRLRKQLMERLIEMITYSQNNGGQEIEISGEDVSQLALLENFLLYGLMPWQHTAAYGSADAILTSLLKSNRSAVVDLLWAAGSVHENVRKRMAWQFSEPVVIKIIEVLEPNNHVQVIAFSEEMINIQEKETIVETSVAAFKKELWLWILNYLFDERGTIYNRIAFMKSTLRQMAAHYNVSYEELFELVDRAVDKISRMYTVNAGFIATIKALSDETNAVKEKEATTIEQATDHWYVFAVLFRDHTLRNSGSRADEFNDLVIHLYREDRSRFAALLLSLGNDESEWTKVSADLNEASLETLLRTLVPANAEMITQSIYFLQELTAQVNLHIESKALLKMALIFGLRNKAVAFDRKTFIAHCISLLVASGQLPEERLISLIGVSDVPAPGKAISKVEIYHDLVEVILSTSVSDSGEERMSRFFMEELSAWIEKFERVHAVLTGEKTRSIHDVLMEQIRLHPKSALQALITYPEKNKLREVFFHSVSADVLRSLIKVSDAALQPVVSAVESALAGLRKRGKTGAFLDALDEHLYTWVVEAMVFYNVVSREALLRFILEEIQVQTGNTHTTQFVMLCNELLERGVPGVSGSLLKNILKIHDNDRVQSFQERVDELVSRSLKSKETLGKFLSAEMSGDHFEKWRKSPAAVTVLNYLVPGGEKWLHVLAKEYKILLSRVSRIPAGEIETILHELYWKCILNTAHHRGNIELLRRSFDAAVRFRFGDIGKVQVAPENKKTAGSESIILRSGITLTLRQLFSLIQECIATATAEILQEGKKIELSEILMIGLETQPGAVRRILSRITPAHSRIRLMKQAASFPHFSLWIMSDLHGDLNAAMEAMRLLYDAVTFIATGATAEKLLDDYWAEAWRLARTGKWTHDDLKKLIHTSFTKMAHEMSISADTVIAEIKKKNIRLTPLLRNSLIACFPAFAALPENKKTKSGSNKLVEFENKELLDNLVHHLILQRQIPSWFGASTEAEVKDLLNEMIIHYPVKFLQVMKREIISESQLRWLHQVVNFDEMIRSVGYLNRDKQVLTGILGEFYHALGKVTIDGISPAELQEIIFRKLVKAWVNNNWKIISTEQLWNELLWDVCVKHGIPKKNFLSAMEKSKSFFPPAMQVAFGNMKEQEKATRKTVTKTATPQPQKPGIKKTSAVKPEKSGISVKNAGIVLLSSYIQMLFERLGVVSDRKFISPGAQHDAVHYLQYVITGLSRTEESFLPLNKVLCGLPVSHPVQDGITITEEQKKLIGGLIKAAIGHWPAIGDTSIDGFRGNWLVRDGLLVELEDKWELIVEKRPYDVLIHKSPYAFSIIRYKWMEKPLHVTWPY